MESLRILAAAEGTAPAVKKVDVFHKEFLKAVEQYGRAHEFTLSAKYVMKTLDLSNMGMARNMLSKGKLVFKPPSVSGASDVKRIFAASRSAAGEGPSAAGAEDKR